jgi:putative flippase GtrA
MIDLIKRFFAWQPTKFVVSGGSAAVVNLGSAYVLTDLLGWWYLASSVVSFVLSLAVSFSLQKFWTFNNHKVDHWHKQFTVYLILAVANLGVNTWLVFIEVEWFKLWYLSAQFITGALIGVYTFFLYRYLFNQD